MTAVAVRAPVLPADVLRAVYLVLDNVTADLVAGREVTAGQVVGRVRAALPDIPDTPEEIQR